jgi:hypothetical protein
MNKVKCILLVCFLGVAITLTALLGSAIKILGNIADDIDTMAREISAIEVDIDNIDSSVIGVSSELYYLRKYGFE